MLVNKAADSAIIRDIEDVFQMVELEATLLKLEYVPKANKDKLQKRNQELIKFKADKYREWLYKLAPKYAETHPYLHFQFARIVTLNDESVVQVMTRLRTDFLKVSVADRAQYTVEAKTLSSEYMGALISKKQFIH